MLKYLLLAIAAYYVLIFLVVVFFRLGYPFELEWMEGAAVDHVLRILSGEPLYPEPSLSFTSFIYPPLFFYLSSLVSNITGTGFLALRIVALLFSGLSFYVIYLIVKKETGSFFYGFLAISFFIATYPLSGAWLDIGRIDTLFLFFLLMTFYLLKFKISKTAYVLAGFLISLATLSKQSALIFALIFAVYVFIFKPRLKLYFIVSAGFFSGLLLGLMAIVHGRWFFYYLFSLPGQHPFVAEMLFKFWLDDIIIPLPILFAILGLLLFLVLKFVRRGWDWAYLFFGLSMILISWIGRIHFGGFVNVLLPVYSFLSVAIVLALNKINAILSNSRIKWKGHIPLYLYFLFICQFLLLLYNPGKLIPTQGDKLAGEMLVKKVSQLPGKVLIPYHGFLNHMAGKESYSHCMPFFDVLRGKNQALKQKLSGEVYLALRARIFSAIILDNFNWFPDILNRYYRLKEVLFKSSDLFMPKSGAPYRPLYLYVPRKGG